MKKGDKKMRLIEAAIQLFKDKSLSNTTVADIAKHAGTAKGTFYLYFKDKDELIKTIIIQEASKILDKALHISKEMQKSTLGDRVVFVANTIIEALVAKKEYIDMIHKNLYMGLFEDTENALVSKAVEEFLSASGEVDRKKTEKKLYLIIEMVGGVCYNSIMHSKPYELEDIKGTLFTAIQAIVDM